MIEDDDREIVYRDYSATVQKHMLNLLGAYFCGEKWEPMPSYLEIAHPHLKKEDAPEQTVEEAKAHVYEMFGIKPEDLKGRG